MKVAEYSSDKTHRTINESYRTISLLRQTHNRPHRITQAQADTLFLRKAGKRNKSKKHYENSFHQKVFLIVQRDVYATIIPKAAEEAKESLKYVADSYSTLKALIARVEKHIGKPFNFDECRNG